MSVLVLIPARGGSKRLPGKNLRTVGGVSLVGRAVQCGVEWSQGWTTRAMVMCDTDSEEIAAEARRYGVGNTVPFLRESEYAQDDTPTEASVIRFVDRLASHDRAPGTIILLQPTSPLRNSWDVEQAWKRYKTNGLPVWTTSMLNREYPNGAVYVCSVEWLLRGNKFNAARCGMHDPRDYMPSARSIDINTAEDLAEAERLWRLTHG